MSLRLKVWPVLISLAAVFPLMYATTLYRGDLPVSVAGLALGIAVGIVWLVKRGVIEKVGLPRIGLEIPLLIFFLAMLAALLFSPLPRLGLEKFGWYLLGGVLLYLLVDFLGQPDHRSSLRTAVLIATAPALLAALLETFYRYQVWWDHVGSYQIMPPYQLRFSSIIGHSNTYMGLINLTAPVAFMVFVSTKKRAARVLAAAWLVMFAFSIPFSSSRGGWLGLAGWTGTLFLLWLADQGRWKRGIDFLRRHPVLVITGSLVLLAAAGVLLLKFYQVFAAHPTHGTGGLNLNREGIWATVIQAWKFSPWLGAGLGRLGLAMLPISGSYPALWWPPHAHSIPLQFLGETGIIGLLAFVGFSVSTLALLLRRYSRLPGSERPWAAVSLAALASIVLQGFFDDFTTVPVVFTMMAVHVALVIGASGPGERFKRIPAYSLVLSGAAVIAIAAFNLWGYLPHYTAASQEKPTHWLTAAHAAAESARRDPDMPFYANQAALAYARAWAVSGDSQHLENARQFMQKALALEPNNAVNWANLALLHWQSGDGPQAVDAIQRAVELGPHEVSFYINYGWLLEQMGQSESAQTQYQQALGRSAQLIWHPFWVSSPTRSAAAEDYRPVEPIVAAHWQVANQMLVDGNLNQAQYELAVSDLNQESLSASASMWAALEAEKGNPDRANAELERLAATLEEEYWSRWDARLEYNAIYSRRWLPSSIVPGVIRIGSNVGQLELLPQLFDLQLAAGECEEAAFTWQVLQREIHAGELIPGGYPPMPSCPTTLQGGM